MGLVELGRHTGLSASFLSQLETGRVVPTLRNLARSRDGLRPGPLLFLRARAASALPRPPPHRARASAAVRRRRPQLLLREPRLHGAGSPARSLLRRVCPFERRWPRSGLTCIPATSSSTCCTASSRSAMATAPMRWRPATASTSTPVRPTPIAAPEWCLPSLSLSPCTR